jgi:hypothetical protein
MIRLVLATLLALACAAPAPTPSGPPPPSGCHVDSPGATPGCTPTLPLPTPGGTTLPLPGPGTRLAAGRYSFDLPPRVVFYTVGLWTTVQQLPGFFDIQDEPGSLDVVAVQFAAVSGSVDEVFDQVSNRPNTRVVESDESTIGGLVGVVAVIETTDPPDTQPPVFRPVLDTAAGPLSIASGRRLWIGLLPVGDGVLAVMVGGSIAKWDRALELAEPVLESIVVSE